MVDPATDIGAAVRFVYARTGWPFTRIAMECQKQGVEVSAYTIRLLFKGEIHRTRFDIGAAILNLKEKADF
jgi:hypothetical protein